VLKQIQPSREDFAHYAMLDLEPTGLESAGVHLSEWIDDHDGLGAFREAAVRLPSETELVLAYYDARPEQELLVLAPIAVDGPDVAHELADELQLPRQRITWLRTEGIDFSRLLRRRGP
jgi:hypothetical protein